MTYVQNKGRITTAATENPMTEIDTNRERLERLQSIGCADYLHMALLARAEKAEAERDTAWNDAIHAAIHAVRGLDFEYTEPVLLALRDLLRPPSITFVRGVWRR